MEKGVPALLGLILMTVAFTDVGMTQPPVVVTPPPTTAVVNGRRVPILRPEMTLNALASAFNYPKSQMRSAALFVSGTELDLNQDDAMEQKIALWREIGDLLEQLQGSTELSVEKVQVVEQGGEATVTYQVVRQDLFSLLPPITHTERLQLHRKETPQRVYWAVNPATPQNLANMRETALLMTLATYIAYPQQMLEHSRKIRSEANMKVLVRALTQFVIDNDERFLLAAQAFKSTVEPYVGSDRYFLLPGNRSQESNYAFNNHLSGVTLRQVKKPSETIMVYEGSQGKLDFRHQGYCLVGFVDQHVEMVNSERAKTLRWQP